MAGTARKRRWPLVVAALAVAVLCVSAAGLMLVRDDTTVPDQPVAQLSPVAPASGGADGCLAGPDITNAALLRSQAAASADDQGAAAFAADVLRWLGTAPAPEQADELAATVGQLLAPTATSELRASLNSAVDSARRGESGQAWQVTPVAYYIESSSAERVVVSVNGTRLNAGQEQSGTQTFSLVRSESGWGLEELSSARTSDDLLAIGTRFEGDCS